ncbi:MAG TPA: cupin domain-containing protein, partial [Usitatibacter sp.]|nr:cupin domain-containing protein [Usitatibacter sp.]
IGPKREVVMARAEIAAGASAGRHSHPGVEVGYVLEGTSEVLIDGEPPKIVKAGESYIIPEGKIHDARPIGDKGATVLATYIVDKDKPLATPAPK